MDQFICGKFDINCSVKFQLHSCRGSSSVVETRGTGNTGLGQKKSKPVYCCNTITLLTDNRISEFLAHMVYTNTKLSTTGFIVSPPNMVCVTAVPCKKLITTLGHVCTR